MFPKEKLISRFGHHVSTRLEMEGTVIVPESTPEIVRKAFKVAQTERSGTTVIFLPRDVATALAL